MARGTTGETGFPRVASGTRARGYRQPRPARWLAREEGDIYIDERMRAQRAIVGVLLLAVVLLVGCDDNGSGSAKAMEVKFEEIDYEMSILETATSSYNRPHFTQATDE